MTVSAYHRVAAAPKAAGDKGTEAPGAKSAEAKASEPDVEENQ